jgi:hypothetical protein
MLQAFISLRQHWEKEFIDREKITFQDLHLVSPRLREDFEPDTTIAAPSADPLAISEAYTNFEGYAFEIRFWKSSFFENPPAM